MTDTKALGDVGDDVLGGEWGGYQLLAELGHGGMADVFLVVMRGVGGFSKLQVLKRLRASLADDPEYGAMLVEEARLAARLSHPNIVQTNSAGQHKGRPYLTMEYLDGQPLHRVLRRIRSRDADTSPQAQAMLYGILADVLGGLHHAHELADFDGTPLRVVHRDVSPQNVFVTYDGQVKVVDFGIAKAARRSTETTKTGVIKGKVAYMAPEQARGEDVDRRADVFAVGVMLWDIATGKRLWQGLDDLVVYHRLIAGDFPRSPLTQSASSPIDVPPEIDAICRRALAPNAEDRYASAAEMQADLEAFLNKTGARLPMARVGEQIAAIFGEERAQARTVIETRLAAMSGAASGPPSGHRVPAPSLSDDETKDVLSGVSTGNRATRPSGRGGRSALVFAAATAALGLVALLRPDETTARAYDLRAAHVVTTEHVVLDRTPTPASRAEHGDGTSSSVGASVVSSSTGSSHGPRGTSSTSASSGKGSSSSTLTQQEDEEDGPFQSIKRPGAPAKKKLVPFEENPYGTTPAPR
jgi:serine/threonine protein kinase